ncbi:ELMO domain-containing protein 3 isoform 2-T4 [Pholidichthys leucotaenia]
MTLEACRGQNQKQPPQPTHSHAMEEDIDVTSHTEGHNGLSRECKPLEEITNGRSNHKPVMNGLVIGHNVKDHTNGCAPLRSLPISALKQNGLLQTLSAGGNQHRPEEDEENVELEKARQEWEALESIQPVLTEDSNPTPLISFNEALQYFQTTDLGDLLKNIQPTIRRTGLAAITHFLFGPPRLHRELLEERDLVFAIAQCPVDNSQTVHMRVLQTIYKRLIGCKLDCPRFGGHWENIGFQGTDPATDLRGTGFLGLMHTLYFVMDPETLPLARDIFKLSQHPTQNFPFSVMSINMTRITLQVLREEALSKSGAVCQKEPQADATPTRGLPERETDRWNLPWDVARPCGPTALSWPGGARCQSWGSTGQQGKGDALHWSV